MENPDVQEIEEDHDDGSLIDTTGIIVYEADDPRLIENEVENEVIDTKGIIIYEIDEKIDEEMQALNQ
jgi:hypothetical protein